MSFFGLPPIGSVERRLLDLTAKRFGNPIVVEIYRAGFSAWNVRLLNDGTEEIDDVGGDTLVEALSKAEDILEAWAEERANELADRSAAE